MNHTPQIKKAIQFAARKHHGQMRAETEPLPYVTHLFSVALLVAESGAGDDVIAAALLHDTLEDTETTPEELSAAFGPRVLELVESVSEAKAEDGQKLPWKDRKEGYLATLAKAPDDALIVAMADKIDNIESKLEGLEAGDEQLLQWFKDPEANFWYHGEVLKMGQERLPEHLLTKRLAEACARERAKLAPAV